MKFSVAMSVYGGDNPSFFDKSLDSISIKQSKKPDEICLVVDGPVPKQIIDIIQKYSKFINVKTTFLEKNMGLGNALKIAVENCSYEMIARMDSDDICSPTRFEEQIKFFEKNKNVDIVGGYISEFVENENEIIGIRRVPCEHSSIQKYLKTRCPFNHVTVMFKKSAILKAGGYQEWHYNEDYYLWIRLLLSGSTFANINSILVNVRTGPNMYLRRGGRKYFLSEYKLQKFMLKSHLINYFRFLSNVLVRFIFEVAIPGCFRGWLYKNVIRKKT